MVASEVRSLAQRSSSAAKEIKDPIATSVNRIRDGSALAGQAGRTMSEVMHAVARATDLIAEVGISFERSFFACASRLLFPKARHAVNSCVEGNDDVRLSM